MRRFWQQHHVAVTAVITALIAIILYWPSLSLPVIYDSLLHIRISDDLTLANVWLPTQKFGFYRPLTFVPLILIRELFGSYPNWLLHGLNVAQHGLNAALLFLLAWRLWHNWTRAFVVGLLFALFPFSFQAIAVYGHNVHPAITGLILLGLHTYLKADGRRQKAEVHNSQFTIHNSSFFWWGVTGFIFLLGLLSHESAILFGAFAALVHWNSRPHSSSLIPHLSFRLQPWMIFLLLGVVYAIGYQFLPISAGPQGADGSGAMSGGSLWLRLLYLLQAAAYPFTWLAHLLPDVAAQPLILGSTTVTLLLTLWAARRRRNRLPLLLGWGWWGLASALIAIPLPTGYFLRGPRLLYLGSVGLALAWGVVVGSGKCEVRSAKWATVLNLQSLVPFSFLAFILLTNWQFVRGKLDEYAELTSPVAVAQAVMAERPSTEGVILINLPQWLSPPRNAYALGGEFVAMLGNYLFADELIGVNVGPNPVYPVVVPDLLDDPAYHYGLHNETTFRGDAAAALPIHSDWAAGGSQLFIVRYRDTGLQVVHAGGFKPDANWPGLADFGPYELLEALPIWCDGGVQVDLAWRQIGPVSPTTSIFVQLLAEDGRLIAQADGPPLGLRPDLLAMAPGWKINDRRTLELIAPGTPHQLLVGVYDFASGERVPAFDSQNAPLPDNALRLPVMPCPQ